MENKYIGHSKILQELEEAFVSGRPHHAWIISGIEGVGKRPLARYIAHFVMRNYTGKLDLITYDNKVAPLIRAGSHPDLFILKRPYDDSGSKLKKEIPVADVRELVKALQRTASYNSWRVVIIEDGHTLNEEGQNAILKFIEEPPDKTLVLIITEGALLPTIRSRARILHLDKLEDGEIKEIIKTAIRLYKEDSIDSSLYPEELLSNLAAKEFSEEILDNAVSLANGSAGFAMQILGQDVLHLYSEMRSVLAEAPAIDMERVYVLAEEIGKKDNSENLKMLFKLLCSFFTDEIIKNEKEGNNIAAKKILRMLDVVNGYVNTMQQSNMDAKLTVINMFAEMKGGM
ncbi:MAG: hypothetical protein FWF23_04660 [Alphaproteobacteria bacterium]|nr:hypothetical protein [Alphaproteobacteria bacterium]MCL2505555.1 hypothetical protein [Alphaproteobacteria bacterium]